MADNFDPCPHSWELKLPALSTGETAEQIISAIASALQSLEPVDLADFSVLDNELIVHVKFGP
jgi:hypothetical protein